MKKIAILLAFCILLQDISFAFVTRNITVRSEKIIPFSFSSKEQDIDKLLSIRGFLDAEIKSVYVDNGDALAAIKGNYIDLELSKGTLINGYKTVNKVDSIDLEDIQLTDEINKTIIVEPDRKIKSIQSVSGDFSSATIEANGNIKIKVKDSAKGVQSYDETKIEKSEFSINVDSKNLSRRIESSAVLPHKIKDVVRPKSGDTSNVQKISVDDNEVTVVFDNGTPIPNEKVVKSGYTFFWVDRSEAGRFKPHNPNAVYSTDINKITGKGKYIGEEEFDEIGLTVTDENWKDFCGIEKDGIRYVYVFDKSKGVPKNFSDSLVAGNRINFEEQNFNSEKYAVEFSNAGVSYIPEGKLYSMGDLVPNTNGWGEIEPNHDWESPKTFFNELTGKYETYVKHFKFFYGPREKETFGGYYTYPYICTFEYEHYKPVTCYSGEVFYEYESQEKIEGYLYNGWIKIEYTEEKEVNDYPPTAPFNVKYNSTNGNITWEPGSDDYTKPSELRYEIEIFDGTWKSIANKQFEELVIMHKINYTEAEVRIRTIDEYDQGSDWSYSSDSQIALEGELKPYVVKPGDTIDIFANTRSLEKIKKVIAKNDELKMYLELQKNSESVSNFCEVSYDIESDLLLDKEDTLNIENARFAKGSKEVRDNYVFYQGEDFVDGDVTLILPEDIELYKSGTVIFSSLNYNDTPIGFFRYNSKNWYVGWYNRVFVFNKTRAERDLFIQLESTIENTKVGNTKVVIPKYHIRINKFEYDENGSPVYEYVDVDKKYLLNPFCVTWDTDSNGVTSFYIYSGSELIYKYDAQWENINKHVDKIYCTEMHKQMKSYSKSVKGYVNSSSSIRRKWNEIVVGVLKNYDVREFPWLGFRIGKNECAKQEYVDEYNSNIEVRNNYRLLISNNYISNNAIKRYMDILKTTNISMTRKNETVFGDDVMEYTSMFEKTNVKIPSDARYGNYEIQVIATDDIGNVEEIRLTLIIQEEIDEGKVDDEIIEESKEPDVENEVKLVDNSFGRFFYKEGEGYLEELKKTNNTADSGFICAGETLGITLITENVEYIDVNFIGDESIKTLDSLTKKFLIDIPEEKGKDTKEIRYQYINFPKRIYPQYVDNQGMQAFKWFYTVPYGTRQTLESWSTLKNNTLEKIDTTKLFDRINEPYRLEIRLNGDPKKSIYLNFDVFERWDTVLNRDITEYVNNSHTRWEMRIDK